MSYLMIESVGVADKESFTMLGASTARGQADKIGMFGSGATHATLCCLRHGLDVYIFSDNQRLLFYTELQEINGQDTWVVYSQLGQRKPEQRDYSIEFGQSDWTSIDMALREYVSNAIDACGWNQTVIRQMDKPRARKGYTRIFIPMNEDVSKYFANMKRKFLHASNSQDKKLLPNMEKRQARIYRKGVFVRELASHWENSLYDYNFGDELPIDESRNMDDYKAKATAAYMVSKNPHALKRIFNEFKNGHKFWEAEFSQYSLDHGRKFDWQTAFEATYGKDGIVTDNPLMVEQLRAKGYTVCQAPPQWYMVMTKFGIRSDLDTLSHVEQQGGTMVPVTDAARKTLDKVWAWMQDLALTNGKHKPSLACFVKPMEGGGILKGHYKNGTVFVNVDEAENCQTMFEELSHHITGANDNSRDFQDFAFLAATRACKVIFE
jgi:hypothetical protein